ncbi:PREDICTED: protein FAM229A-like [Mesitornis unicolor]|uniref:protein FAM229A-like n=1 Tax=Mesitornis unicolor TaxID=54374 RepID=UPI00052907FD|nr:PREDICTED: protein FAM229A-like [Mesitornis unicolor]
MNFQRVPQAGRFPMGAGDCPSLVSLPEGQEPAGMEWAMESLLSPHRELRRCPGKHCLTVPNVPIDVFMATGGTGRRRNT